MFVADAAIPVKIVERGIDWPGWIGAGVAIATFIAVVVTATLALLALRDAKRTRHGQLIADLTRDWTEDRVLKANELHGRHTEADIVALVDKIFGPGEEEATAAELHAWTQLALVANLIESLGVLVSEDALTDEVVYKMWGGAILSAWPKWDEAVGKLREYDGEPDTFVHFEEISAAMRAISDARQGKVGA